MQDYNIPFLPVTTLLCLIKNSHTLNYALITAPNNTIGFNVVSLIIFKYGITPKMTFNDG